MENIKEVRKKIRNEYGGNHPVLGTFDRVAGKLLAGEPRISLSMIDGGEESLQHFLALSKDSLHFLEMRFILPEKGGRETELPPKTVKRWFNDQSVAVLHPESGDVVQEMDKVCIWFYPRGEV